MKTLSRILSISLLAVGLVACPGDTTPPTVSLSSNSSKVIVPGSIVLTATATDDSGVTKVEFFDGATKLSEDTTSPYEQTVAFVFENNGSKSYSAKAYDAAGNSTISKPVAVVVNIPDTTPPTVSLSSTATNVTTPGAITLSTTATDNVGVSKVEFFDGTTKLGEDLTIPFEQTINLASENSGAKSYKAKAYDVAGNSTSSNVVAVTVNIPDTTPPTVSLSSSSTSVITPGAITLTATPADNLGVTKVEFFEGTTKLGEDLTAPYEQALNFTIASNGSKSYTAKVFDAAGNSTSSSAVTVVVNIPDTSGPAVSLSSSSTNVTTISAITLTAIPTDDVGVTKVEFYDGTTKLGEDLTAPYEQIINLAITNNGSKSYTAKAFDAANNSNSSSPVVVTVNIPGLGYSPTISSRITNWGITPYGTGSINFTIFTGNAVSNNVGTSNIDSSGNFNVTLADIPSANLQTIPAGPIQGCDPGSTAAFSNSFTGAGTIINTEVSDSNGKKVGKIGLTNDILALTNFSPNTLPIGTKVSSLFYSTGSVVLSGTCIRNTPTVNTTTYDFVINPGWNYLILTITGANTQTYTSGTLPANVKWYYVDYPDFTPPTVSLSSSSTNVTTAGAITLNATATDDKAVTKVEFYDGSTKIGEDLTAPYEQTVNFTAADNSTKFYTAKAFDAANNSSSSSTVTVTVNIQGLGFSPSVSGQIVNWTSTPYGTGKARFYVNTNPPSNQNFTVGTTNIDSSGNFNVIFSDPPAASLLATPAGAFSYCNAGSTAVFSNAFGSVAAGAEVSDSNSKVIGRTGLTNSLAGITNFTLSAPVGTKLGVLFFSNAATTITGTCLTGVSSSTYNVIINPGWNYLEQTVLGNNSFSIVSGTQSPDVHWYYADLPDTTPPTVSLSSSSNSVITDSAITLTATATDNVGVARVEFYDGTTKIGEDLTAPYEQIVNLTAVDNGTKSYEARAFDTKGNQASSNVLVVVNIPDTKPPTVSLSSSTNNVLIVGPITLTANATDNVGVTKVEFYAGATKIGEDLSAPFEQVVNLALTDNGSKTYSAVAHDAAGNFTTSGSLMVNVNMPGLGNNPTISGQIINWTSTPFGTGSIKFVFPSGNPIVSSVNSSGNFNVTLPNPTNLVSNPSGLLTNCNPGSTLTSSNAYSSSFISIDILDNNGNPVGSATLANSVAGLRFFPIRPVGTISVGLQYSDSATILSGTCNNVWGAMTYNNVVLNPGWNYVTTTITGSGTSSFTTGVGALPSNLQWYYADITPPTVFPTSNLINVKTPGAIILTADATDNVGVSKVVFYDITNSYVKLGEDLTTPYEQVVNFTVANNGTRMYHAVAYDAAGTESTSSTVFVNVAIP